jgi:hypothetical protein
MGSSIHIPKVSKLKTALTREWVRKGAKYIIYIYIYMFIEARGPTFLWFFCNDKKIIALDGQKH